MYVLAGGDGSGGGALVAHVPLRLELVAHGFLGEDGVAGETADTTGTTANRAELGLRDAAAVATDGTGVAARVIVHELARGREVESSECARFPKQVAARAG